MSNIIYEDSMYNESVKFAFMSEYGKGTQKTIARIFKISRSLEMDFGKDLYNFNREELRRLFYLFMAKTEYSSKANVTWVGKYLDWAIDEGYLTGISPLEGVSTEWKEQFVVKNVKKYWTDQELFQIMDKRVNAQDAVIISLLMHGIRGIGNSEILNLTKDDIDAFNQVLHVCDENFKKRSVKVSERCIQLCEKALREDEYEKKNGNTSKDIKAPTSNLVINNFVVRSSQTRTEHFNEAEKNIVHRRLSNIADEIGEPHFTPMNIVYSGMIAYAKDLYLTTGRLEDEEYKAICEQFNIPIDQSLYRLKNEFLNLETIKEMYKLS